MAKAPVTDLRYELEKPFAPETVKWRLGSTFERNGKLRGLALAYIDARHVMDRLDSVVGHTSWQSAIAETPAGRVLCTLSLRIDDQWVAKTDGAGATQVEGDKGGISDALKRAAVQWGIGRYLYAMGETYVDVVKRGNSKFIEQHEYKRLARVIRLQFEGKFDEMAKEIASIDQGAIDEPTPAATKTEAAATDDTDQRPLEEQMRSLADDWQALIADAGTVDDLKLVHADLNKHRQAFASMGPEFVDLFKQTVTALQNRKAAIDENDAGTNQRSTG